MFVGGWSATESYPETGCEEINGDLPEEDFWEVGEISFVRLETCSKA
jgi:hypothetical protein